MEDYAEFKNKYQRKICFIWGFILGVFLSLITTLIVMNF